MKTNKARLIILRIIASPFVLGVVLVSFVYYAIRNAVGFTFYGGEWITYRKEDKHTINEIYHEIKNKNGSKIIELEEERFKWSMKNFPDATAKSSLLKLREEIEEINNDIDNDAVNSINEEYADALMCLFDSAGRLGIKPKQIFEAFQIKTLMKIYLIITQIK